MGSYLSILSGLPNLFGMGLITGLALFVAESVNDGPLPGPVAVGAVAVAVADGVDTSEPGLRKWVVCSHEAKCRVPEMKN